MKLTDRVVAGLPVPAKGMKRTPDDDGRGLNALVTANGWRGFVLRYRIRGRERSYTIGAFPDWTVAKARVRAGDLRRLIDQGIDPHEQDKKARDEAITVADFWTRVYEPHHVPTLRPKWQVDVRGMFRIDILPKLGRHLVKDIDHADVAALHRSITRRGSPGRANRTIAVLSNFMSWTERPHVTGDGRKIPALRPQHSNPCRGIRRNPEERRQRFLQPDEMARLAAVLEKHPERTTVALVRFLLLTGCRFSEAASATWDQFNLEAGTWTKPSAHTKQKRVHVVPLSKPALMLLQQLHEQNGSSPYLFPGPTGRPITTIKSFWKSVTKQAKLDDLRVHDLRHSFASVLASGGASLLLIGQLLGHTQAQTTQRYAHLLDSAQRDAVERAAAVISGNGPVEVVPMRSRR